MAIQRLLITEAFEDENFFKKLLGILSINDVQVTSNPNAKGNAIRTFGSALKSKTTASQDRIGVVIDADYTLHGAGYTTTLQQLNQNLVGVGFNGLTPLPGGGLFTSNNKYSRLKVGAWVMPNNQDDGAMEDFLLASISTDELARFRYAKAECTSALNKNLGFPTKSHHISKAEYGTWTAWQDPPRSSFAKALQNQLFDITSPQFKAVCHWLHWLYI